MSLEDIHHITGIAVDVAIFAGAIAAAIRFRVFNVFGYRWRTDVACSHTDLTDGTVIFLADYVVSNTGRRPLKLTEVTIEVRPATQDGLLLVADETSVIAERTLRSGDPALKGIFQIEPGERTIFPLRVRLPHLPDYVFVVCTFATTVHRTPTLFRSFYVKAAPSKPERPPQPPHGGGEEDEL